MDHIVTLTNKQETALQSLVDRENSTRPADKQLTPDDWIRRYVLNPIKQRQDEMDAERVAPIIVALPDATNAQLTQIKTILGIS